MPPFHLAFPILDIAATRAIYSGVLGCVIGREGARWIDFDFWLSAVRASRRHATRAGTDQSSRWESGAGAAFRYGVGLG
jgi:extradiol dioxygenase family protein